MDFAFLYDRHRKLMSIGYRLADTEGPGRLDTTYYDLLASEARLASFVASLRETSPAALVRLGRQLVNVKGRPTLVSWSASMFEYLMPELLMKSYPNTLLQQTSESVVIRQREFGEHLQVPWEFRSARSTSSTAAETTSIRRSASRTGLEARARRRPGHRPYATALAAMVDPKPPSPT